MRGFRGWILLVLVAGVGARLALAWVAPANYDQLSYGIVVSILDHGGNVYAETARYNYSPVWMWLLLLIERLATFAGVPFPFATRSFLTAVDVADALLVGIVAARLGYSRDKAIAAYLLNPIGVLLTGMHGQFEDLAALPLLLALVLLTRTSAVRMRWIWALGAAAILLKHIVLFSAWALFLGVFRAPIRALFFFCLAVLVFLLSFVPYLPTGADGVLHHVFLYAGLNGFYGIGLLSGLHLLPNPVLLALFIAGMFGLAGLLHRWNVPLAPRLEVMAIAFIALTPGISQQYLLLPILFGAWRRGPGYWVFTAAAVPEVFGNLVFGRGISLADYLLLWTLAWAGALTWLYGWARELRRGQSSQPVAPGSFARPSVETVMGD